MAPHDTLSRIKIISKTTKIGPQKINGRTLVLRRPRVSDAAEWRRISIRDRELDEPFAPTSTLSWDQRHTFEQWVRTCVALRRQQREGRTVPFVLEVDGRFAGRCAIAWVEPGLPSAELSIWIDGELAGGGVAMLAGAMMIDFAFDTMGLELITAGTGVENVRVNRVCEFMGMHLDATMDSFFDAGGMRKTYNLWTFTRADIPAGGFARQVIERRRPAAVAAPAGAAKPERVRTAQRILATVYGARMSSAMTTQALVRSLQHPPHVALGPKTVTPGQVTLRDRRKADLSVLREILPPHADAELPFAIELDGVLVGECWLRQIHNCAAELGFSIVSCSAESQIRTAAAELLVDYAFEVGCERLWIAVPAGGAPERELASNLGMHNEGLLIRFQHDGTRTDNELWAVTAARRGRPVAAPDDRCVAL
ncbi:GNAT family N-acetyltransferase [Antrihabitans cavernicola]|nr:GNAT family N-acetyltransferase [Spelaeibacter cavernicola]